VRVKVVDLTQLPRPELVISELRTMQAVQSPNLASLREAYIVDTQVWLVTEDLPGGSLVSLIERHQLDENQIAYVAREVRVLLVAFGRKSHAYARSAKGSRTCMLTTLSTAISSPITSSSMLKVI
jgi:hypothetical protein